jgi:UDP-N-acetylmuramoylalanine--D-glutamate ligase
VEAIAEAGEAVPNEPVTEPPAPVDDDVIAAETETLGAQEISAEAEAAALAAEPAVAAIAVEPPADDEPTGGGPPPHLIPPPPPGPVFEHLPEVWVLELSSFQLDGVQGFEPTAATVLNVTQDHLDWHGSMESYAAAKARIFGKDAVMVINRDDPLVEKMIPPPVPGKGRFAKPIERHVVRFGLDAPQRPGDFGVLVENGIAWLVRALEPDESGVKKPKKGAAVEEEDLMIQRLMPADALRVRGRHNAANALAALALATAAGSPLAPMLHGLREYAGEPHRVEFVATVNGVEAYDDSKGTNVGATVAALNGLGEDKSPSKLVVILGGDGKGQDFSPLATPVQRHVRAVATLGRDAEAIEQVLRYTGVPVQRHATLEEATRWAFQRAHAGDAVLLSPACASLDMFRNYAHRAEVFVAEVQAIASAGGEVV